MALTYEQAIEAFKREDCRNCRRAKQFGCGSCKVQLAIILIQKAMAQKAVMWVED